MEKLLLPPGARVLDAGCGRGRNALYLARLGHEVVAVDNDREYLDEAEILAKALGAKAIKMTIREGDIRTQLFEPASFDAVFMTYVLHELGGRRRSSQAISQSRNATKNGGYNLTTAYVGSRAQREEMKSITVYRPHEIASQYRDQGWQIVHTEQRLGPLKYTHGRPSISSYEDMAAQKPADPLRERARHPAGQLPLEYLQRADPELYDYLTANI